MRLLFNFVLTLVLLAITTSPAEAASRWLRADAHNFIVYSDGDRTTLARYVIELQRFDALLRQQLHVKEDDNPIRLPIYLLHTARDVATLTGNPRSSVAGFYHPDVEGSFAVGNRERQAEEYDLSGLTVLKHEYTHHFMFNYFSQAYPSWYVEGIAEFFSTATFKLDGNWLLGGPAMHRSAGLVFGKHLPIESLLFDADELKGELAEVFYGRSWLLVHLLTLDPSRSGQLDSFNVAIARGIAPREAAATAFGDLAALERDMDRLATSRLDRLASNAPIHARTDFSVTELPEIDSHLVSLTLQRRTGGMRAETLAGLRSLTAAVPANADAWHELARAERMGDRKKMDESAKNASAQRAEAAVARALANNPSHARANLLMADLLMDRLGMEKNSDPARWKEVRDFIRKANAQDADDPLALYLWYQSFSRAQAPVPPNARDALAQAYYSIPESDDLRAAYALDLASQRKFDEALAVAKVLTNNPHAVGDIKTLLERIMEMRDAAASQTTSSPPHS